MNMRHALARIYSILDCDVKTCRAVYALDHTSYFADCEEQIGGFVGCQVGDARDDAARRDEDVAWDYGFEVDEGEGKGRLVEDLFP